MQRDLELLIISLYAVQIHAREGIAVKRSAIRLAIALPDYVDRRVAGEGLHVNSFWTILEVLTNGAAHNATQ